MSKSPRTPPKLISHIGLVNRKNPRSTVSTRPIRPFSYDPPAFPKCAMRSEPSDFTPSRRLEFLSNGADLLVQRMRAVFGDHKRSKQNPQNAGLWRRRVPEGTLAAGKRITKMLGFLILEAK